MPIHVLDTQFDNVIKSHYIVAVTNYGYAIDNIVPLINRFNQQRYTLNPSFYEKLKRDIENGCIMPPLTLAINADIAANDIECYINQHICEAFVLDGIQRLNTIKRIDRNRLDLNRPVFLNILICRSMDKLLYRMITLNNGQKPMSARHQIEILAGNIYNFDDLEIDIQTEKQQKTRRINGAFKKEDIIKAYLAFVSNSINIDNQKIIESKLDELVTEKIIESDITERDVEFSSVVDLINSFTEIPELRNWFLISNNLIGFAAGISKSYEVLMNTERVKFLNVINTFEGTLSYIDVSKIKLGLVRRKAVKYLIENYSRLSSIDVNNLTDIISQVI